MLMECFSNCMCDLDDTIEDIDVGEHCAVLGGRSTGWLEAHVLHQYTDEIGKALVGTDVVWQEAFGVEVVQSSGGRSEPRHHFCWQVVCRRCDGNGVDSPVVHFASFEQH